MMQITSSEDMKWIMSEPTTILEPYMAVDFYTLFAIIALLFR
jgi:hypothetical protein